MRVEQASQIRAFMSVQPDRQLEAPHRDPKPRCLPLMFDRLSWTPAQQRLTAAVLGDYARHLVLVVCALAKNCPERVGLPFAEGMDHDMVCCAVDIAKDAWHYASLALDAEELAAQSINGVVR